MCLSISRSYPSKIYFRKIEASNLKFCFYCSSDKTQENIFEQRIPIMTRRKNHTNIQIEKMYGSVEEQSEIIESLLEIDLISKEMKENST